MRAALTICLAGSLVLLGGCFDRSDHPAKDSDPSKPSLQMQQPDKPVTQAAPDPKPMPSKEQDN